MRWDRCAYCGGSAEVVEHMIPLSRGGRNTIENRVPACGSCNTRKGNRTPLEWFVWQLDHGERIRSNNVTRWTRRVVRDQSLTTVAPA